MLVVSCFGNWCTHNDYCNNIHTNHACIKSGGGGGGGVIYLLVQFIHNSYWYHWLINYHSVLPTDYNKPRLDQDWHFLWVCVWSRTSGMTASVYYTRLSCCASVLSLRLPSHHFTVCRPHHFLLLLLLTMWQKWGNTCSCYYGYSHTLPLAGSVQFLFHTASKRK